MRREGGVAHCAPGERVSFRLLGTAGTSPKCASVGAAFGRDALVASRARLLLPYAARVRALSGHAQRAPNRHLRGERGAPTRDELRGDQLFRSYGCVACHQGMDVGGNSFQRFGRAPRPTGKEQ